MKKIELLQAATPTDVEILSDNIIENIIGGASAQKQNASKVICIKGYSRNEQGFSCNCGYRG